MRPILTVLIVVGGLSTPCLSQQALRFKLDGSVQTILPLGYSSQTVLGLQRNGYLVELSPSDIKNPQVIPRFLPLSQADVRGELLEEFGKEYEVSGTGNYLVVHPRGAKDMWANHFEELYRSMTHFFRTRGYPMTKPRFPLVGVVFHSENQYLNYCRSRLNQNADNTYGVYIPRTNRIYLYDATRGMGAKSPLWETNLATVMHEVAHQTAFNTGIHVRGANSPAWIIEGIGCQFEARGIYDSFRYKSQQERLNDARLRDFNQLVAPDADTLLPAIVASNKPFQRDPVRAYAGAWALTFYLSERQPRKYMRYLQTVAKYEPFDEYSKDERIRDFTQAFGKDLRMLSTRTTRFIQALPTTDARR